MHDPFGVFPVHQRQKTLSVLSLWDCEELARKLEDDGIDQSISAETIRRILHNHHLKPWRHHMWLGAKTPRDEAFRAQVKELCDLYTRAVDVLHPTPILHA